MGSQQPTQRIRFSVFEVDFQSREIWKRGVKIRVQEQPLKILSILIANQGRIVTREELRRELWPEEVNVDFTKGINTAVTKLRESLGDSSATPRFIETVPRRGYRFIAPVDIVMNFTDHPEKDGRPSAPFQNGLEFNNVVPTESAILTESEPIQVLTPEAGTQIAPVHAEAGWWSKHWFWLGVTGLLLGTLLIYKFLPAPVKSRQTYQIRTLAVLPLQNLSNDPAGEYFADSMTEALITKLAQTGSLRVISRTSIMHYKRDSRLLPEIAKELNADGLIEGSVVHSGKRVRITVQLLDASDQHLWAESFERDDQDILGLQDEVSQQITNQITMALAAKRAMPSAKSSLVPPEAYEAYSRGLYLYNQRTPDSLQRSLLYFEQTIQKAPNYALGYGGLAKAYVLIGGLGLLSQRESFDRASELAHKCIQLDPSLAQPHVVLAEIIAGQDWDWAEAEKEYQQAMALNPNDAEAHRLFSSLLSLLGRHEAAISEARRAVRLDPLSLPVGLQAGIALYLAGRFDEAIKDYKRTLELNASSVAVHVWLGLAYRQMGKLQEALGEMQRATEISHLDSNHKGASFLPRLAEIYAAAGRPKQALALLKDLEALPKREQSAPAFALVEIALGKQDEALRWLEAGFQNRDIDMTLIGVEPGYKPIRSDPRFRGLLKKMNLPDQE